MALRVEQAVSLYRYKFLHSSKEMSTFNRIHFDREAFRFGILTDLAPYFILSFESRNIFFVTLPLPVAILGSHSTISFDLLLVTSPTIYPV